MEVNVKNSNNIISKVYKGSIAEEIGARCRVCCNRTPAVVPADFRQHRMRLLRARRHQVRDDPIAGRDPQPPHAPRGYVDAVAVLVNQVSVAVGVHRKYALVGPLDDSLVGRAGLAVAVQVHEHQQHVGEIDHQADRHGNQQVEHQIGVFRLQFHGMKVFVRFQATAGNIILPLCGVGRNGNPVILPARRTRRRTAYSRGPCGG